ncbi:MAG: cell division ATP-binding protein FtsE [Candidatus Magasanikbacteria bacterium CG10_big_fil_rev_8_21_14_0_10_40_10]|uniref:Cell division ATP-binding protein FtsE n=1 Tax=Candidatus Magasanikbacteria bacterium CG10_big_fil_rev_8_21_14_0_10_40_10 TaxID=1974648 RepID=A0A2M6W2T4_9BACT|nr:MAG: cell division ATP-binding protein FtsE [Candidatus Magasanikbacteria bacterium CG10_big_fil_rev_8_21_14_0_10_40_10]
MIRISEVTKIYTHKAPPALRNINLFIDAGEFVSIVGQSGTGKTTLVKLIIAEEKPTRGTIDIGDCDITKISASAVPFLRRQIGVVFQDFRLLPKKTVHENVSFALEVAGEKQSRIRKVVPQVLEVVGLSAKATSYPYQLSGGEQQRAAIARALAHAPKILVADEPTGNLDTINTHEVIEILKKINEFGTTILLVTHNRETVNHLRRRVVTLQDGEIASDEKVGKYKL